MNLRQSFLARHLDLQTLKLIGLVGAAHEIHVIKPLKFVVPQIRELNFPFAPSIFDFAGGFSKSRCAHAVKGARTVAEVDGVRPARVVDFAKFIPGLLDDVPLP
ncbi:hypothetical protein TB1_026554 [Malus domestica]